MCYLILKTRISVLCLSFIRPLCVIRPSFVCPYVVRHPLFVLRPSFVHLCLFFFCPLLIHHVYSTPLDSESGWTGTVILPCPIGQFEPNLRGKRFDGRNFFWLELQKQQNQFLNPHCLNFSIGGLQDHKLDLNSTKIVFF